MAAPSPTGASPALETNLATLHRRWPGYYRELAMFRRRDPWAPHRAAVFLALAAGGRADVAVGVPCRDGTRPVTVRCGAWRSVLIADPADLHRLRTELGLAQMNEV